MTVLPYSQLVAEQREYYESKGYKMSTQSDAAPDTGTALDPFDYQAPTEDQTQRIIAVRGAMKGVRDLLQEKIPRSRELSLAITKLEECSMWANKGIVFNGPKPEQTPSA